MPKPKKVASKSKKVASKSKKVASKSKKAASKSKKAATKSKKLSNQAPVLLAKARSLRRGTLTVAEFRKVAGIEKLSKDLAEELRDRQEDPDSYGGDMYLWKGDLVAKGNFKTGGWMVSKTKRDPSGEAAWLIVTGDLIVEGCYEDTCNDAPDRIYVLGDLRAHNVISAGHLDVRGDLCVRDAAVFDWNIAGGTVRGDLVTRILDVTDDHAIDVKGAIKAPFIVEGDLNVANAKRHKLRTTAWSEIPFASSTADRDALMAKMRDGGAILEGRG